MAEEQTDANTDIEVTDVDNAGPSPDVEYEHIEDDDGLISTTEFKSVEVEETDKEAEPEAEPSEGAEQKTPETESTETKAFHEHPRFKELISEKNELKAQLEKIQAKLSEGEKPSTKSELTLDWAGMDNDNMVEAMTENPKQFFSEMFQLFREESARIETEAKLQETQAERADRERKAAENYFTKTDGALDMWKDGTIQKYMEDNPGETPISAHKALTGEARIKALVDEERKKAAKETEEKIYKTLKAKGRAASNATNATSRSLSDDESPEVKNPDKFGGAKAVAVKRYLARQGR